MEMRKFKIKSLQKDFKKYFSFKNCEFLKLSYEVIQIFAENRIVRINQQIALEVEKLRHLKVEWVVQSEADYPLALIKVAVIGAVTLLVAVVFITQG